MGKKKFPEKEAPKGKEAPDLKEAGGFAKKLTGRFSGFYSKAFGVIKFILGICLLPFVFSTSVAFLNEFSSADKYLQSIFWNGTIAFLAIYLFAWEPLAIYNKGHKLLEIVFSFFKPMVNVAPYLLPIYTILIFVLYGLLSLGIKADWLLHYALFLAGFTIVMHLVFSSKSIRGKKGDFLKGNYIFGFSFIYILNLALLSFCFSLIFKDFSFVNFCNSSFSIAKDIFRALFKQLFVV